MSAGLKERDLRALGTCAACGKKLLASGLPLFWRVTVERFGVDLNAMQRQQGLTMLFGGNAAIAAAMGPDEDMARPMMDPVTVALCEPCGSTGELPIAAWALRDRSTESTG